MAWFWVGFGVGTYIGAKREKDLGLQFNVNSQLELVLISVTGGLVGVALGELDMTNNHLDEVMTAMMNK